MRKKQNKFFQIVRELGIDVENRKFEWLTNQVTPSERGLWQMFIDFKGNPKGMQGKRCCKLNPDGYLPEYNCIIEFDEVQHFTEYRLRTLMHYPSYFRFGFDIDAYRVWCIQHSERALKKGQSGYRKPKPEFPFQGGRAAQRALFDACRDLLPPRYGLNPTIRISEFQLHSLLSDQDIAMTEIQAILERRL